MKRTSRRHKLLLISGIISAGAIALAGCSSASSGASGSSSPSAKSSAKTTLVIYSAQGYDHAAAAAFQKAKLWSTTGRCCTRPARSARWNDR